MSIKTEREIRDTQHPNVTTVCLSIFIGQIVHRYIIHVKEIKYLKKTSFRRTSLEISIYGMQKYLYYMTGF